MQQPRDVSKGKAPVGIILSLAAALIVIVTALYFVGKNKTAEKVTTTYSTTNTISPASLSVPISMLKASAAALPQISSPNPVSVPLTSTLNSQSQKPTVFYFGAEWCPYCAAQRWPLAVALSEFGSFSPFKEVFSSSSDVYPSTPSISFYKNSYESSYINFVGVEYQDSQHQTLATPTQAQISVIKSYDTQSFTNTATGSIPFLMISNKYASAGAYYNPAALPNTQNKVIADIHSSSSKTGQAIRAAAYNIVKAICSTLPASNTPKICAA